MNKKIYKALGILLFVVIAIAAFLAFIMQTHIAGTGGGYDGLGRTLSTPPLWAQTFVGREPWPGLGWRLFDSVWFFGGLYLAFSLYFKGDDE